MPARSLRYLAEIPVSKVHGVGPARAEALRSVGRELMRNHLKHCATAAIRSGGEDEAEAMYDEIVEMMYRNAR